MSELTPCNYCTLKHIRARAREDGEKVTLAKPKDKDMDELMEVAVSLDGEEVAWFMKLTDHCVC